MLLNPEAFFFLLLKFDESSIYPRLRAKDDSWMRSQTDLNTWMRSQTDLNTLLEKIVSSHVCCNESLVCDKSSLNTTIALLISGTTFQRMYLPEVLYITVVPSRLSLARPG